MCSNRLGRQSWRVSEAHKPGQGEGGCYLGVVISDTHGVEYKVHMPTFVKPSKSVVLLYVVFMLESLETIQLN